VLQLSDRFISYVVSNTPKRLLWLYILSTLLIITQCRIDHRSQHASEKYRRGRFPSVRDSDVQQSRHPMGWNTSRLSSSHHDSYTNCICGIRATVAAKEQIFAIRWPGFGASGRRESWVMINTAFLRFQDEQGMTGRCCLVFKFSNLEVCRQKGVLLLAGHV
jgi:hypothetical protein